MRIVFVVLVLILAKMFPPQSVHRFLDFFSFFLRLQGVKFIILAYGTFKKKEEDEMTTTFQLAFWIRRQTYSLSYMSTPLLHVMEVLG